MNFGSRAISMFNRVAPKISRGIGQVADIGRNIGQVVKHGRNIGSIANQISGGRLSQSHIGQKIQDAANKIESGANFISGNEDRATGARLLMGIRVWFRRLRTAVNQAEISIASTLKISSEVCSGQAVQNKGGYPPRIPDRKDAQVCRNQQNTEAAQIRRIRNPGKT